MIKTSRGTAETQELLARGGPRDILARIVPEDPLNVRRRTARRVRERALLVDVERGALRAFALIAARGPRYRGRPRFELWMDARIDEALDELVDEDKEGLAAASSRGANALVERLGVSASAFARGRVRFHDLPFEDRDAFLRLVVETQPLEETARIQGVSTTELARRARRALIAFLGGQAKR